MSSSPLPISVIARPVAVRLRRSHRVLRWRRQDSAGRVAGSAAALARVLVPGRPIAARPELASARQVGVRPTVHRRVARRKCRFHRRPFRRSSPGTATAAASASSSGSSSSGFSSSGSSPSATASSPSAAVGSASSGGSGSASAGRIQQAAKRIDELLSQPAKSTTGAGQPAAEITKRRHGRRRRHRGRAVRAGSGAAGMGWPVAVRPSERRVRRSERPERPIPPVRPIPPER